MIYWNILSFRYSIVDKNKIQIHFVHIDFIGYASVTIILRLLQYWVKEVPTIENEVKWVV